MTYCENTQSTNISIKGLSYKGVKLLGSIWRTMAYHLVANFILHDECII